ncbi:O-antigen ligase [Sphingobium wenxiniae]|uniref:O-antigen ligase n=1 Tax=Sphingobium wenxiniae (strain DSM 21828 / CGMCC 1.7748 / JZ-1) TaxID=595605 RepID=A0A562KK64_SPHWJ|nr:O-antigen ligase [Sphingobium wenxiniae]MBB6192261.1 O-antigen ligase [Sphingobium wenxiniae]TWH95799.1 O-antigen ligase [Sphingobium wenxiniae]
MASLAWQRSAPLEVKASQPRESQRLILTAQIFYFVFLMMVFIGQRPFAERTQEELVELAANNDGGDLFKQALFIGFALLLTGVQIIRKHPPRYKFSYWPVVIMLAWFCVTCTWGVDPFVSFKRVMQQIIVIYITFCTLSMIGPERLMQSLRSALILSLIICWMSLPIIPAAVHPPSENDRALVGAWRGFFFHKNIAGAVMALCFMVTVNAWIDTKKWIYALWSLMAFVFVVGTKSKTSLALSFAILMVCAIYRALSDSTQKRAVLLLMLALGMVGVLWLYVAYQPVVERIFADPTSFTGRVSIWHVPLAYLEDHPFLGAGFGGFWQVGDLSPSRDYINQVFQLRTAHSHNGYLEIWVTTGPLGLVMLLLSFVALPAWWFLTGTTRENQKLMVPAFAIWVFVLYQNLLETSFFDKDRQVWVIFLAAIATAHATYKARPRRVWNRRFLQSPQPQEPAHG